MSDRPEQASSAALDSVAQQHKQMVSRWRAIVKANAPQPVAALSSAEFEELASLLEESYQEALVELAPHRLGPELEDRALDKALARLGSWHELLDRLNRTPDNNEGEPRPPEAIASNEYETVGPPSKAHTSDQAPQQVTHRAATRRVKQPLLERLGEETHQLRLAARSIFRARTVALSSIALLGLGLGIAIALFAIYESVVREDLPYTDIERLGIVRIDALGRQGLPRISASNVIDFREGSNTISELHLVFFPKLSIGKDDTFDLVRVASLDAGLPASLGVEPAIGRLFDPGVDAPSEGFGNVLLSHELWTTRYSADPDIVGRTITLSQQEVEVVGVLKPKQTLLLGPSQSRDIGLWTARSPVRERGTILRYTAYVRLSQGASFDEASAELQALADRGRAEDDEEGEHPIYAVTPLMDHVTEDARTSLLLLLAAAVFVLLLACVNVAGLLAARALSQTGEWAVRAAMGASRARLLLGGLAEGVVLAMISGAAGLAVAHLLLQAAARSSSLDLPRIETVGIGPSVLLFAAIATGATAVLTGLLPAWRASAAAVSQRVERSRGGIAGAVSGGTPLVVVQVALALLLLAGTGVLLRTFLELQQVHLGYNPNSLLTFDFSLNRTFARRAEGAGPARMELNRTVIRELEQLPEVQSASLTNQLPMGGQNLASYSFDAASRKDFGELTGSFHRVFPNYFSTMEIEFLEGRDFTATDMETPNDSVIVSRLMAESAWPNESAVGKYITIEFATADGGTEPRESRVIGVVDEVREVDLHSDQSPQAYLAYGQNSWAQDFVVRTHVPPQALVPKIDALLKTLGPGLVVDDAEAFAARVTETTKEHRQALQLAAGFSLLALLIASLGIYAAMAHRVATRTREIGLRMAMGAKPGDLLSWVLQRGLLVTLVGIGCGLAASFALLRLLESFVFGVSTRDPLTLGAVGLVLLAASSLACWLPAQRASQVDPALALASD